LSHFCHQDPDPHWFWPAGSGSETTAT
jgi:hypothetical protein